MDTSSKLTFFISIRIRFFQHNRPKVVLHQRRGKSSIAAVRVDADASLQVSSCNRLRLCPGPFAADELQRIALSLDRVKDEISLRTNVLPEQVALINKKLDEIKEASKRLGRKDWILYFAGTTTSICTSAAFPPEITKGIFTSLNAAFS